MSAVALRFSAAHASRATSSAKLSSVSSRSWSASSDVWSLTTKVTTAPHPTGSISSVCSTDGVSGRILTTTARRERKAGGSFVPAATTAS